MRQRTLGRTGLGTSEIGFGTWGIGNTSWIGAEDQTSVRALMAARDAGINFFDTALVYGRGHSERLLAKVFGRSEEILIASKVPPKNELWPAPSRIPLRDVFPKWHVLECLRKSLANLQRKSIDLYQFHVWSDEWADDPQWLETVEEIRRSGQVRFIGISINDHQPTNILKALATGLIDSVQVIYNVFDQSAEDELFPYCQTHDIGVIARVPFDEGGLTGAIHPGVNFPAGDFRNRYFAGKRKKQVWERVQRLTSDADIQLPELPDLALRFCLSHGAVATVIPGMRTPSHVHSNVASSDGEPLPDQLLSSLHEHRWNRNFYDSPVTWEVRVRGRVRLAAQRILPPELILKFREKPQA
ncbi:MAG TPA: aldo/keto reductase [Terriglobales bacterium]